MKPTAWIPGFDWPNVQMALRSHGHSKAMLTHLMHGDSPENHQPVFVGREIGEQLGFTWDDVDRNRTDARDAEAAYDESGDRADYDRMNEYRSLADRIAALLPPRDG